MTRCFDTIIVLSCFNRGLVILIKKRGKPTEQSSSCRLVTISSVFCKLFKIVVLDDIYDKCKMPLHKFGFHKGSKVVPMYFIFLQIYYLKLIICRNL